MSYERLGSLCLVLGNPAVTIEKMRKAIAIHEELSLKDPTNRALRAELAKFYQWMGLALGASVVSSLGDVKGSLEYQRKSQAVLETLVAEDPTNLNYRQLLGAVSPYIAQLLSDSGNQVEALDSYRKALVLHQSLAQENPTNVYLQRELAVNYSNVCGLLTLTGDNAAGVENCRQALAIFESMAAADPKDANMRRDVAIIHRKN